MVLDILKSIGIGAGKQWAEKTPEEVSGMKKTWWWLFVLEDIVPWVIRILTWDEAEGEQNVSGKQTETGDAGTGGTTPGLTVWQKLIIDPWAVAEGLQGIHMLDANWAATLLNKEKEQLQQYPKKT